MAFVVPAPFGDRAILPDHAAPSVISSSESMRSQPRGTMCRVSDMTRILGQIQQGDPHAAEQLLPLVYDELRKLAAEKMANERPGQTLQATALVHEAYLRLVDGKQAQHWNS